MTMRGNLTGLGIVLARLAVVGERGGISADLPPSGGLLKKSVTFGNPSIIT